jgi:PBP1b-binding outer membrane lipoprotein LpoB
MNKMGLILLIALAFVSCDNDNKDKGDDPPPQPHQTTITAFGKDITVIGDAAISTADFNTAKGKLEEAMVALHDANKDVPSAMTLFNTMLDRAGFVIIIGTGNASPDAEANKSMTVGIDYLLENDAIPTIALAILNKVGVDNAFAD